MTVVYIPGWILFTLTLKLGSEFFHNTFSYRVTNSVVPTTAQLLTLATEFYNVIKPGMAPFLSTQTQFISMTARDMSSATGVEATYTAPTGDAGTYAADPEPLNVCAVVSLRPALVAKGAKGRIFIGGMGETLTASDAFTSTMVAALATLAAAIKNWTGDTAVALDSSVASRKHAVLRSIITALATSVIDNQIRRLPGHRRHKRHVP